MTDINPASRRSKTDYRAARVLRAEHSEDSLTLLLEQQTAKVPSNLFLFVGLASMAVSLVAELAGNQRVSRFVGMWPSALLIMGLYNKLVKVSGPA